MCDNSGLLLGSGIEDRVEELVKLIWSYSHDGGPLVYETFMEHVHCHVESGQTCPLADTALQHPELAVLDGELDVLHVLEVLLQMVLDIVQFLVYFGHGRLKGCEVAVMLVLGGLVQRVGSTDTCDYVFALCVDEPFSVELVLTGRRVT